MIPIQFKDQVARKYGYKDWEQMAAMVYNPMKYLEEAALLYAQSKWDEACGEQRDRCVAQFINSDLVKVNQFTAREYCSIAPKPEFKP